MASSQPQNTAVASGGRQVNPSEVGWQFVPQYYTFVNKHPSRLHCFYTKNSTFIHGTEGEDGKPCYGQQEIHAKILSLDYNDCKVFIHSVDAQSSANNGIIIQVIGEMSNRGEPWKKFVQTFFLAEQPNGYFVLNDIFRFLKEDTAGEEEEEEETVIDGPPAQAVSSGEPPRFNEPEQTLPAPTAPAELVVNSYEPEHPAPQPIPHPVAAPPQVVIERQPTPGMPTPVEPQPVEEPKPEESHFNGINGHADENESVDEKSEAAVDSIHAEFEPEPVESIITVVEPTTEQGLVPTVKAPSPAPAPAPASDTTMVVSNVPATLPAPEPAPAPSGPKTWATLAASSSRKWGNQIATEAKGVSAAAPQAPSPMQAQPKSFPNGKASGGDAASQVSVTTGQCFVKLVTENVQENVLKETLISRFGPIKDLEIVRNKACAFLEFVSADAARKAILASLPVSQGGEGGIRLEGKLGPTGLPPRVIVETRKERGDRPISTRGRGGPPGGGEGRGVFTGGASVGAGGVGEGRGGSGRGRGIMRGRGAPQAAR